MTEFQEKGLSSEEVARRVTLGLVNRESRTDAADYWEIFSRNFFTIYNFMVIPAAILLLILGEYKGGLAVSGMAFANLLLGLGQEIRAKRLLEKLALLTAGTARVLRDGGEKVIPSQEVVQGDVLFLGPGEPILADGTVLQANALEVDEALLTGESDPISRKPGDSLLSGGFCVTGQGIYRADRVGSQAFAQKTTIEARSYHHASSPLQQNINHLVQALTATAVVLACCYCLLYFFTNRIRFDTLVQMIAATLTSLVPQGLVLMTTFSFLLGAIRLSKIGALVQQLNAVETMASIDTLCMDKTGTLTTNQLQLQTLIPLNSTSEESARLYLQRFVSAMVDPDNKSLKALKEAVGTVPVTALDQLPFKSQNRYSAVWIQLDHQKELLVLGAYESLQSWMVSAETELNANWNSLLPTGFRLLVLARAISPLQVQLEGTLQPIDLQPLALLALSDQLRPEAKEVLENLARQGISFRIISGDNPATVRATLKPLIEDSKQNQIQSLMDTALVTGDAIAKAADGGDELIRQGRVFGRVTPWQKVKIVKSLQNDGFHLAMMGDGVNDVLPIKNANLGIAMGSGSRASKTVAGLVLTRDDFGLLPRTLDEGRVIIRNLRRIGKLLLTKNINLLTLIIGTVGLLSLPFPFLPQQVTLINTLINGIPVLLLVSGHDIAPSQVRSSFFREVGGFALHSGFLSGLAGLCLLLLADRIWQEDLMPRQTMVLVLTVLLGWVNALRLLHEDNRGWQKSDFRFWSVILALVPVLLMTLYIPSLADFFQLWPLDIIQWQRVSLVFLPCFIVFIGIDFIQRIRIQIPTNHK